ncbi:hypothetical protein HMPREF9970_2109 [Lachnoanaerobaculum saburreum F0468]|uniref:Uncharacterized protein n=2 Tax=Lachnoanaerobaculum saburreum TaxID=467210 RepID=I0R880_9FIRM|nr:hypothetical protein HMPREF0381_0262 [Lachnoanaerobaculum saburreum DSM 3986]EIC95888.1 hypothetical protein HMPREF9970_2109 [Lachnoanaerobaculum saburreum F0468]
MLKSFFMWINFKLFSSYYMVKDTYERVDIKNCPVSGNNTC